MSNKPFEPIKLKVRQDGDVIRASIAMTDGTAEYEIGTLSTVIAQQNRKYFDSWVACCTEIMKVEVERITGVKVSAVEQRKPNDPHERN